MQRDHLNHPRPDAIRSASSQFRNHSFIIVHTTNLLILIGLCYYELPLLYSSPGISAEQVISRFRIAQQLVAILFHTFV